MREEFAIASEVGLAPGVLPINVFVDNLVLSNAVKNDGGAGAMLREELKDGARGLVREQTSQDAFCHPSISRRRRY